jgi:hypothetical protein
MFTLPLIKSKFLVFAGFELVFNSLPTLTTIVGRIGSVIEDALPVSAPKLPLPDALYFTEAFEP